MATGDDRIGLLFWEMTLDDEEFNKKIVSAEKSLNDLDDSGSNSLTNLAGKFAGLAVGVTAAVGGLTAFSVSQIEQITQTKILADSIGATTAEVEGLTIASEQLVGDAGMVIDKMREVGGIDAFKDLADDVKNAGDEQAQLNKAVELFGGEGAKMLAVLQQGSEGLEEFERQALATGRALSPEETEAAAEAYQNWNELVSEATGLARQLGVALGTTVIPILKEGVEVVSDLVTATNEIVDGFNIWIDEILGIEDPLSKGITAEELLAAKTAETTKELEKQANALKDLDEQAEKTFESELFAEQLELDMLEELREELGLTEQGLSKIAGMAGSAFRRGDTVEDVAGSVRELLALRSQRIFNPEDFEDANEVIDKLEPTSGTADFSIFGDLDQQEAALNDIFDRQQMRIRELMSEQANAPAFAEMATAGSVAEFRILNQNDEKTQKSIEKNTAKVAKQLERLEAV